MQKKKTSKSNEKVISAVIFIVVAVWYFVYGYGNDTTNVVQNNYASYEEQEESNVSSSVSSDLEVYVFDVGQADSILVANRGEYMLIDAGNNSDGKLIVSQLTKMGINKIDYLIGTHPHEDHIGGLDNVIKSLDIGTIYMPKREADTKSFEDVLDSISAKKLKVTTPKVGTIFNVGEAECEVISVESNAEDTNDSSIVIELTFGNKKYLFTGDAGQVIEKAHEWDDIDVLKVGHHGSRTSSSKAFLNATKPEIALISLGEGNDYGHPHKEALSRLNAINAQIYRTDESGTIYLKCDGENIEVECLDICLDGKD